ncbi:hypothetical protein VPNG_06656 [Cytospora leucostoma]|uniref:Uncharacterized protein n=1 Tax=Cytospora leucostoma TaxID=1230097 RepID=A0A423WUN2_9PEZI|nr:hypothetical protein VPNG_06656 [Cytospora leucostoma]
MPSENQQRRRQLTLRTHVPRAGFVWQYRHNVLARSRGDRAVLDALRTRGGANFLQAGARSALRQASRQVEQILADLFVMAEADAQAGSIGESVLDWIGDLGGRLRWAQHLEEETVMDLFLRLYNARRAWHEDPREPFDTDANNLWNFKTEDHGVLAHAIDNFHAAASDGWAGIDGELWLMAQPARVEEGEAERTGDDPVAAAAPHTQGMGALAAAGEPHPQTPLASGGAEEDEDGDVQMGDGEEEEEEQEEEDGRVREVRERLAGTSLGEEMEVDE